MEKCAEATVTRKGALDMQVCVPKDWSDEQVIAFANLAYLCGTSYGWQIRRKGTKSRAGKELLGKDPERNPCNSYREFVHIMLDSQPCSQKTQKGDNT